jgi:hypothetical protein
MITLQDCIAFSELDEETLHIVAARCTLPELIAAQHAGGHPPIYGRQSFRHAEAATGRRAPKRARVGRRQPEIASIET